MSKVVSAVLAILCAFGASVAGTGAIVETIRSML